MLDPNSDSLIAVMSSMAALAFTNPFTALTDLNILGIVTNAILIGIAMVLILDSSSPLFKLVQDINNVIIQILEWVIRLLPLGIFVILFDFTIRLSAGEGHSEAFLSQLFQFGGLVVLLTLIHGLVILPLIAWMTTGRKPIELLSRMLQPLLVAFSTSSSAATLPVSMRAAEEELNIDNSVSSFVLPLGATMNMDGTALFEAMAAIFLAYLYGIELSTVMVITIFLMSVSGLSFSSHRLSKFWLGILLLEKLLRALANAPARHATQVASSPYYELKKKNALPDSVIPTVILPQTVCQVAARHYSIAE